MSSSSDLENTNFHFQQFCLIPRGVRKSMSSQVVLGHASIVYQRKRSMPGPANVQGYFRAQASAPYLYNRFHLGRR